MRFIGNILWLVLTGFMTAIMWLFLGIFWCITIIGIPFGLQCFKYAKLSIWPFGTKVYTNFGRHPIANIIWIIFGGCELAIAYIITGLIWCVTIVGLPFGLQCFKFAHLSLMPFGATVS